MEKLINKYIKLILTLLFYEYCKMMLLKIVNNVEKINEILSYNMAHKNG
jgi:hypothetical protein